MSRVYFRQLLSGRDFAKGDPIATQMKNFVYLIGDEETKQAVVVDPAYKTAELCALAESDGMTLVGALATHYHADHIGGTMMGFSLEGIRELLSHHPMPIHCQRTETEWIQRVTGASRTDLAEHDSGDTVMVGSIPIQLIHTPGHTPGSQCFLVDGKLVAGDTLFLDGCGRTDLPGGSPAELYESLTQRLAKVPDTAVLYPGHLYSPAPHKPLGAVRSDNFVFKPKNVSEWLTMFG